MRIELPELCLVALMGASGSGKSTFAKTHFKPTEVLNSDFFRGLVSDDETDQSATSAAFDSLYYIAAKRLEAGRLTVIDATNVQRKARDQVLRLAREQNVLAAAIVLDMPQSLCIERNRARPDRNFGPQVVQGHARELRRSIKTLRKEGFRFVYTFTTPDEAADAELVRTKLRNDKKDETGPFDIIGDVHGCHDELCILLEKMGYTVDRAAAAALPPAGRRAVFLGDLCDRGPKNPEVLRLVMNMAEAGLARLVCEEKHMGSRAVIVLCRSQETARDRFGVPDGSRGIIYTRTGRHFFDPSGTATDAGTESLILERLGNVLERTGFWEQFNTGWVCLDTELMPWSAKARSLLLEQYAPVGRSGRDGLAASVAALKQALSVQGPTGNTTAEGQADTPSASSQKEGSEPPADMNIAAVLRQFEQRRECLDRYTDAYRRYCWTVSSIEDYRIAPFHILATEGKVRNSETHLCHMETIRHYMTGIDPLFMATSHIVVDLHDDRSLTAATDWWLRLTGSGGEGMVVKPLDFIARRGAELLQPAVKCRGREYLRIIYGPEYTTPEKLERLRNRSLAKKRRLALAEFALGQESLERFVRREPFHRLHECVFAVLALENEAVDPRL